MLKSHPVTLKLFALEENTPQELVSKTDEVTLKILFSKFPALTP